MKRILCCLLVWVMLLCVLPVGALAAMQITEAEPAEQKSVAPQLPYEGACIVVDEEDLPVYTVPAPSKPAQKGADGTVPYYGRSALQKMADGEKTDGNMGNVVGMSQHKTPITDANRQKEHGASQKEGFFVPPSLPDHIAVACNQNQLQKQRAGQPHPAPRA